MEERKGLRMQRETRHLQNGGIHTAPNPLKHIKSISPKNAQPGDIQISSDPHEICDNIQEFFIDKWKATENAAADLQHEVDTIAMDEPFSLTAEEILSAIHNIKKKERIDKAGHSGLIYQYIPLKTLQTVFQNWVNSRSKTSARINPTFLYIVRGYARGKARSDPAVDQIRIITPQNHAQSGKEVDLSHRCST